MAYTIAINLIMRTSMYVLIICKNYKKTLNSQINPISHLKTFCIDEFRSTRYFSLFYLIDEALYATPLTVTRKLLFSTSSSSLTNASSDDGPEMQNIPLFTHNITMLFKLLIEQEGVASKKIQVLTLMLPVANLANTKWCQKPEKLSKSRHTSTHLRVINESCPINTNTTGFKWFSKIFQKILCFRQKKPQHRKG